MKAFLGRCLQLALCLSCTLPLAAQTDQETFKPNGRMLGTIFADARMRFENGKRNTAFELKRAYLGYEHHFTPAFSGRVLFDISNDASLSGSHYNVYVKTAYLSYRHKAFTFLGGMILTDLYPEAEQTWAKRYLSFNINELAGFGTSADVGIGIVYQPDKRWTFKAQLLNGEGYKRLQADSTIKVSASVTYRPTTQLTFRLYADAMRKDTTQLTLNAFASYKNTHMTLGAECGMQRNNKMLSAHHLYAYSVWGTYHFSPRTSAFARFDDQWSKKLDGNSDGWNARKDCRRYIIGFEYCPIRQVRIAPNVQITDYRAAGLHTTTDALLNLGVFF